MAQVEAEVIERVVMPQLPPELVSLIVHHLYQLLLPPQPQAPSPDPNLLLLPPEPALPPRATAPGGFPTPTYKKLTTRAFAPPPIDIARAVLGNLCLVNKTWNEPATRALWKSVGFGMPNGFQSVLRTAEEYSPIQLQPQLQLSPIPTDFTLNQLSLDAAANQLDQPQLGSDVGRGRPILPTLSTDSNWGAMAGSGRRDGKMIDDGSDDLMVTSPVSTVVTTKPIFIPEQSPLLHTNIISFCRFRTAGMARSISQGSNERFVTAGRLLIILRGTRYPVDELIKPSDELIQTPPASRAAMDVDLKTLDAPKGRLDAVGFTEFMDSAINLPVLEELLLRGGFLATVSFPAPIPSPPPIQIHPSYSRPRSPPTVSRSARTTANNTHASPPQERGRERVLNAFRAARDLASSKSPTRVIEEREDQLARFMRNENGRSREDEENEEEDSDAESETASSEASDAFTPFPTRSTTLGRRMSGAAFAHGGRRMERRGSGTGFLEPGSRQGESGAGRGGGRHEEEEERGRSERGRSRLAPGLAAGGSGISSFASRSSSVPAAVFLRQSTPIGYGARSSSVPAAGGHEERKKRERQESTLLEGSKTIRPIRALDLNGCVSQIFIKAIGELIEAYHLGPLRGLAEKTKTESDDEMDVDGGNEDDEKRTLVRVQFPHLRRLGLAASLLPSAHLTAFVSSFPFLTHLDLTSTLTSPLLLYQLAQFGQAGPGGRSMRLVSLSLARCRLMTGAALVGLLCGDCPPFTSIPTASSSSEDPNNASTGSWGSGQVVSTLTELSLYGDSTYPSPLTQPELRLILSHSPAFMAASTLRSLDLSSCPLSDTFLITNFPSLPHLIELGLANCRMITFRAVATLLEDRVPGVEVLDLTGSCLFLAGPGAAALGRRMGTGTNVSIMELHGMLLGKVASVEKSGEDEFLEEEKVAKRKTNLRVVELGQKALEGVQGGAGDWKVIWGKGRRGWYVDVGVTSIPKVPGTIHTRPRTLQHLPREHPTRIALQKLVDSSGAVSGETGWHPRKMEVLRGEGMMSREDGLYGFHAFQV
ncbi:hypothetical protein T439DRAFT_326551 [Meredithblackwellia eburnea MCA 4105]